MARHTYSMIAGSYSKGKPCSINEGGLQEKRNAGQLQIVALAFREDVQDISDRKAHFYGLCRFTAFLRACATTFPIRTSSGQEHISWYQRNPRTLQLWDESPALARFRERPFWPGLLLRSFKRARFAEIISELELN
jgi:hypothetical protein